MIKEAGFFGVVAYFLGAVAMASTTSVTLSRIEDCQIRMIRLAIGLDDMRLAGAQYFPSAKPCFEEHLTYYYAMFSNDKPDAVTFVKNNVELMPWVLFHLWEEPEPSTSTANLTRSKEAFTDPFSVNRSLRYYAGGGHLGSTEYANDYIIVSIGPDGVDSFERAFPQVNEKDCADAMKHWNYVLGVRSGKVARDIDGGVYDRFTNAIYDPTNGVVSDGDIVFHWGHGTDSLFRFYSESLHTSGTIVPRPVPDVVGTGTRNGQRANGQ